MYGDGGDGGEVGGEGGSGGVKIEFWLRVMNELVFIADIKCRVW